MAGYAVADALVRYTVKQAVGVLFGGCELRAKELDFLMALTDRAGRLSSDGPALSMLMRRLWAV